MMLLGELVGMTRVRVKPAPAKSARYSGVSGGEGLADATVDAAAMGIGRADGAAADPDLPGLADTVARL